MKKDVFDNKVFIFGFDEIPDHSKTKIVVLVESWGLNDELKTKLSEFYKGKTWQNTYILILPKVNTIFSYEILEKGKRLKAAENLMKQVKDEEGKLNKIIQEERKDIADKINAYYGYIVKWVEREGELTYRLINVSADVNAIREKARSDLELMADFIVKEIEDKPGGIRIEELINDFKRYRRCPFILDDEIVYTVIRNLHRDKRIVIQGERGKWYIDESPRSIEPSFVIIHPKYTPEVEKPEISEKEKVDITTEIRPVEVEVERKEKKELSLTGNSPRVILSQVEARTSEKDEFEEISVRYRFKQKLSKQEIMKFIKQLPYQEESEIEVEVVLWRKKDET